MPRPRMNLARRTMRRPNRAASEVVTTPTLAVERRYAAAGARTVNVSLHEALTPPCDVTTLLREVPELELARGQGQGPFHHLDTFEHILETVRGGERELAGGRIDARVNEEGHQGVRVVALLHDVARLVTRA